MATIDNYQYASGQRGGIRRIHSKNILRDCTSGQRDTKDVRGTPKTSKGPQEGTKPSGKPENFQPTPAGPKNGTKIETSGHGRMTEESTQ